MVTLGCARNDVDSEELAGRLQQAGWALADDPDTADAVVVNTCGFVEAAKQDSIDTILELAGDTQRPVVAVGCLAERYGKQLAAELPEAAAVLGFDSYETMADTLTGIINGERPESHEPIDRRSLLPISPVEREAAAASTPGHANLRVRLESGPVAPLKIASGCDRRCSFCAIPRFRGAFQSRRPADILREANGLVESGVRELNLVSENSTSYGKDLGDLRLLESLLPALGGLHPDMRVRAVYLQPAEMRPGLVEVMADTAGVAPYFDLSFQHASPRILRAMRRFGGTDDFLALIDQIRAACPTAGLRTNVIVGFPGETDDDFSQLVDFVERAEFDAVGVFGYSDEDETEALRLTDKLPSSVIADRVDHMMMVAEAVMNERATQRVGHSVSVLIEETHGTTARGRALHQGPDDGDVTVTVAAPVAVGDVVEAIVDEAVGVDLEATAVAAGGRR